MAGTRTGQRGVARAALQQRRVDRVGGHHRLPLRPLAVADADGDRATQGQAVPQAPGELDLVGLEAHPRATAVAEAPPGELGRHLLRAHRDARRPCPRARPSSAAPCDSPAVSHRNTGPSFHVADGHRAITVAARVNHVAPSSGGPYGTRRARTREHEDEDPDGGEHRGRHQPGPGRRGQRRAERGGQLDVARPQRAGVARCTAATPRRATTRRAPATPLPGPRAAAVHEERARARQRERVGQAPGDESVAVAATASTARPSQPGATSRSTRPARRPHRRPPQHRHPGVAGPGTSAPRRIRASSARHPGAHHRSGTAAAASTTPGDHAVERLEQPIPAVTRRLGPVDTSGRWGRRPAAVSARARPFGAASRPRRPGAPELGEFGGLTQRTPRSLGHPHELTPAAGRRVTSVVAARASRIAARGAGRPVNCSTWPNAWCRSMSRPVATGRPRAARPWPGESATGW